MNSSPPDGNAAPRIPPLDAHAERPIISVVIPTYEPGPFLADAIVSVLAQDLGSASMQIAVVDDGSKHSRPSEVLREVATTDRIEYYEHTDNVGLAGNWNRAIGHARGQFVHILHQDDTVHDGFYTALLAGLNRGLPIGMAFCRHAFIDENDTIQRISHRERWRAGILARWCKRLSERQRVQCPAAIVRRDVYEDLGGFRSDLRYALDWEMWVRIACRYAVWYEPQVLAHYRRHASAETARLRAAGRVTADLMHAIELMSQHMPAHERGRMKENAYRRLVHVHSRQARKLLKKGADSQAAVQIESARAAVNAMSESLTKRWLQYQLDRLECAQR